jgi:hypothetical protein
MRPPVIDGERWTLASAPRRCSVVVRAFTLTELMIAVIVLVVVIIATSKIFATASHITAVGQATASLITEAATIQQQMRDDLAKLTPEGYFAIRCVAVRNNYRHLPPLDDPGAPLVNPNLPSSAWIRADQLLFFAAGVESVQTFRGGEGTDHRSQGTISRVYYGHAFQLPNALPFGGSRAHDPAMVSPTAQAATSTMTPWFWNPSSPIPMYGTLFNLAGGDGVNNYERDSGSTYPSIIASQPTATHWLLARQAIALLDDDQNNADANAKTVFLAETATARSIFLDPGPGYYFGWSREIRNARLDAAASLPNEIRRMVTMTSMTGTPVPRPWRVTSGPPSQRDIISRSLYYPRGEREAPSMHRVDQALTNHIISGACSSFIIDWTYCDGVGSLDKDHDGDVDGDGLDSPGVLVLLNQQQPWFGMPAMEGPQGQPPPTSFGWPDQKRGTRPFVDWWEVPPNNHAIFPENIDGSPSPQTPNAPAYVYEAFFGYNQDKPYNGDMNPPVPDAHVGIPRPTVGFTPWPSAIRVTMTLHDPGSKLENGRAFQFVIDLPRLVRPGNALGY